MCGRYSHLYKWKQLHRLMRLTTAEVQIPLRFNVAPTQSAPIVRADGAGRALEFCRWGLIPSWAKDASIGARTINARSETVATTPAFRAAYKARRCLVPVSGFYEWQAIPGAKRKQPWHLRPNGDDPFVFAGLWESWRGEAGTDEPLHTFTILTTTPNATMRAIHDRMPVILAPEQFEAWLDPELHEGDRLAALLAPCPDEWIAPQRVGTWVNSPAHDDAKCIEPVEEAPPEAEGGLFG